jgi:hypothetical protein
VVVGERLSVVLDATFDSTVRLTTSCDPMAGAGVCLIGSDSGNPESFVFTATTAGDYYVVAAAYSSFTTTGTFSLKVDRQTPGCMLGSGSTCQNNAVQFCNSANYTVSYVCDGTCTNGLCDMPRGANCFDAKALTGVSGSQTGTFSGASNAVQLPAGTTGPCVVATGDVADGGDTVYTVALAANDLLELDLVTTSTTAQVYILDTCADTTSCAAYKTKLGAGKLYYLSPTAKTVSVVVDNTSTSATTTFTLNHRISNNAICIPGSTRCLDGSTALVCNSTGQAEDPIACRDNCVGSLCADNTMVTDTCAAAAVASSIGEGISVAGQFAGHTNTLSLASADCGNIGTTTPGADVFYRIELAPGEGVKANATTPSVSSPKLYFLGDDCMVATCRAGGKSGTNNAVSAFYINETMGTESILVVLDSTSAPTGNFALSIAKYFPSCTPSAGQCVDANTSETCLLDGSGYGAPSSCALGCDAALGLCNAAVGDRCDVPVDLVPGVVTTANLSNYVSNHTLPSGSCTGYSFSGRDSVWRLPNLPANQNVRITVDAPFDSAIWLPSSCNSGVAGACLAGKDGGNPEILNYTTTTAGDLLIVAGAYSATATPGSFTILAELLP